MPDRYARPDHDVRPSPPDAAGAVRDLERCPACGSPFVQPVDWEEADEHGFVVLLRCPECPYFEQEYHDDATLWRYDAALDEGLEAVKRDLRALKRANMADYVERFVVALREDAVCPMDF